MKNYFTVLLFVACVEPMFGQNIFSARLVDSLTGEPIAGVSVQLKASKTGAVSDSNGNLVMKSIPNGRQLLILSSVSYRERLIELKFPLTNPDSIIQLQMSPVQKEIEQVTISSSRTDSRIENTPIRVEVLGSEDVDGEVGIKPGNIASLLGDIAGIQTQQTSASSGNAEMRMQGLPGKYTQLLRDGVPLFGGYSGSFSILQVPPLDLRQIEIVKGSVSTLYGGGAIAGMINLVSKKPRENVFENTALINQSSLKETNANIYLSNKKRHFGYNFFTGLNHQKQVDVNKDGFSDVPHGGSYFIHPSLFFYPGKNNSASLDYNGVFEKRKGGDMQVLNDKADNQHQYFNSSRSQRHTVNAIWESRIKATDKLSLKGTASWFDRKIETNVFGMKASQLSYYTEAAYVKKSKQHDLVAGFNFNGELFKKSLPDSSGLVDYNFNTLGLFLQDDWRISKKITLETGMRLDHHNQYRNFYLPRLSLLYKIGPSLTSRMGGGVGYRIPTLFDSEIDERDYKKIIPVTNLKAEKSIGLNWDINFSNHFNGWDVILNQTFYFTGIRQPVIFTQLANTSILFYNAQKGISTHGSETYVQLDHNKLEIYLGYTYTVAKKLYDTAALYLSLSAKNKFASVIAYQFTDNLRAGIEAAITGRQYLDDGSVTPAYPFVAAMVRYDYKKFAFVLNCENLLDYRQTKKEDIVSPPYSNPEFKQLWAPVDGRVVNLSVRITLNH